MLWYRLQSVLIILKSQLQYGNSVYFYENYAVVGMGISPTK